MQQHKAWVSVWVWVRVCLRVLVRSEKSGGTSSKRALLKFTPVLCVESRGRQRLRARIWANVGFRAGVSVGLWLEFRLGVGFMHWLGLVLGLC